MTGPQISPGDSHFRWRGPDARAKPRHACRDCDAISWRARAAADASATVCRAQSYRQEAGCLRGREL